MEEGQVSLNGRDETRGINSPRCRYTTIFISRFIELFYSISDGLKFDMCFFGLYFCEFDSGYM